MPETVLKSLILFCHGAFACWSGAKRTVNFWELSGPRPYSRGRNWAGKQPPASQASSRQSWGLGSRSPISSSEASSTSNQQCSDRLVYDSNQVYTGSRGEHRKGWRNRSGPQDKLMHPERSSSRYPSSASHVLLKYPQRKVHLLCEELRIAIKFLFCNLLVLCKNIPISMLLI